MKCSPHPAATPFAALHGTTGPRYWRSLEELADTPAFQEWLHREFPASASESLDPVSRRDFLRVMAASFALGGLTACTRQPPEYIVPYVQQPEPLVLGQPLEYATAMTFRGFGLGLVGKTREGRPIKLEGNPDHPLSLGATNIFGQAELLSLYDPDRSHAVTRAGEIDTWERFLAVLGEALLRQRASHGAGLRVLTRTVTSPTLAAQIRALLEQLPEARWHQYDPIGRDHVRHGAQQAFGQIVETHPHFDRARVVVSLDADFLFAHPAALGYARQFARGRDGTADPPAMNRLYVLESTPTITGANADHRRPSHLAEVTAAARALAQHFGIGAGPGAPMDAHLQRWVEVMARDLARHRGAGLVLAGESQPAAVHALLHHLNHQLGNVGPTLTYRASAEAVPLEHLDSLRELTEALAARRVELLLIFGGNVALDAPADLPVAGLLRNVPVSVHIGLEVNETAAVCQWHIPMRHFLEDWSDVRAYDGTVSIVQPLIEPLHGGQSPHAVLEAMLRQPARTEFQIVRDHWREAGGWENFDPTWREALRSGIVRGTTLPLLEPALKPLSPDMSASAETAGPPPGASSSDALELQFRPDPNVWDGTYANNAWLQELPRPLSKLTWDNAVHVSPALAERRGLSAGDVVELRMGERRVQGPVWITPGQAERTVTVSCGYGRTRIGAVGQGVGFDVYPLRTTASLWHAPGVQLIKTGRRQALANTQGHQAIPDPERQVLREGTLDEFLRNPRFVQEQTPTPSPPETLFRPAEHAYDGHRWGMSINLGACLGCNACVVACQAENNIPVVGKDQVARGREMLWLRVDAYYRGAREAPQILHQPVPCMHCENAPCEVVCPVAATVHDHEGLNLQVYNRCVGTRYCSNNCPYKVRRFNFLAYAAAEPAPLAPMRNPEVTIRSRGVMEKCTYCIQRIARARIAAKADQRPMRDGEVTPACAQACPTVAIVFGDLSDPGSAVARAKAHPLEFSMLAQLNTRPRTTYRARLRHPNPELEPPPPSGP